MTTHIVAIALALAGFAVEARAQALSIDETVTRALEREPSLRAARADVEASRAMRMQAALRPNPSFSVERRDEPAGMDDQTTVGITWPLDFRRRGARVSVAERDVEVAEQAVADRIRMLVSEVRMRYGQVAAAVRDAAVAEQLATGTRQEFDLLRQRVEQGASPPLERDMLEVELRRFESARLLAAGRADSAMFELKRVLGMAADTPLVLGQTLEALTGLPSLPVNPVALTVPSLPVNPVAQGFSPASPASPAITSEAIAQRSDVLEAHARVRLADARIQQARTEGRLDLSLFGSYMRMNAGFPQRGMNDAGQFEPVRGVFHYLSGGMMVMVPLWNRNQGEIAAAEAQRVAATARLEAAQLSAQAEVASAKTHAAEARKAADVIAAGVGLARKNLDVLRQMYELGRSTLPDVLAEQRRYLEMENAYTAVLREAFEARTSLALAQGELP